mmetsp:Transcript_25404/g.39841  ORF Transcript_25404/g.39841 Transcript_25404/m.39841 type:complete len:89 (+) Transcript_25404:2413-2679(+)
MVTRSKSEHRTQDPSLPTELQIGGPLSPNNRSAQFRTPGPSPNRSFQPLTRLKDFHQKRNGTANQATGSSGQSVNKEEAPVGLKDKVQ